MPIGAANGERASGLKGESGNQKAVGNSGLSLTDSKQRTVADFRKQAQREFEGQGTVPIGAANGERASGLRAEPGNQKAVGKPGLSLTGSPPGFTPDYNAKGLPRQRPPVLYSTIQISKGIMPSGDTSLLLKTASGATNPREQTMLAALGTQSNFLTPQGVAYAQGLAAASANSNPALSTAITDGIKVNSVRKAAAVQAAASSGQSINAASQALANAQAAATTTSPSPSPTTTSPTTTNPNTIPGAMNTLTQGGPLTGPALAQAIFGTIAQNVLGGGFGGRHHHGGGGNGGGGGGDGGGGDDGFADAGSGDDGGIAMSEPVLLPDDGDASPDDSSEGS